MTLAHFVILKFMILWGFIGLWCPLHEFWFFWGSLVSSLRVLGASGVCVNLETAIQMSHIEMITVLGIAISFLQDWDLD